MPKATLKRSTAQIKTGYQSRLPIALESVGSIGLDVALALVPVDTGELKSTIRQETPRVQGLRGKIDLSASTDHCRHVEWGTVNMAAQPYMRPALAEMKKAGGRIIFRTVIKGRLL